MPLPRSKCYLLGIFTPVFLHSFVSGMRTMWLISNLQIEYSNETKWDPGKETYNMNFSEILQKNYVQLFSLIFSSLIINGSCRRTIYVISAALNYIGYIVTALGIDENKHASEWIFKLAAGPGDLITPIYIGENGSPKLREMLSSICVASFCVGMVIESALLFYTTYAVDVSMFIAFLQFMACFWIAETPQSLIMKGNFAAAEKTYRTLLSDNPGHFEELKQNVQHSNIRYSYFCKSVTIILLLTCMTYLSGNWYPWPILPFISSNKPEYEWQIGCLQFCGSFQFVTILAGSFLTERLRKRIVLLLSFGVAAVAHIIMSGVLYLYLGIDSKYSNRDLLYNVYTDSVNSWIWIIVMGLLLALMLVTSAGIIPTVTLLRGELLPHKIKVLGNCLTLLTGLFSAYITFVFVKELQIYFIFLYISIVCTIAFIFVYYFVPETKGKSLVEIQKLFEPYNQI